MRRFHRPRCRRAPLPTSRPCGHADVPDTAAAPPVPCRHPRRLRWPLRRIDNGPSQGSSGCGSHWWRGWQRRWLPPTPPPCKAEHRVASSRLSRRLLLRGDAHQISCTGGSAVTPRAPLDLRGFGFSLPVIGARGSFAPPAPPHRLSQSRRPQFPSRSNSSQRLRPYDPYARRCSFVRRVQLRQSR